MPSSRGSSWPRDRTRVSYVSCIGRRVLTTSATWEVIAAVPIYIPINSVGGFPSLHTLSSIYCGFFDDSHFDWCEVIPHCSFDLHFSTPPPYIFSLVIHLISNFENNQLLDWGGPGTQGLFCTNFASLTQARPDYCLFGDTPSLPLKMLIFTAQGLGAWYRFIRRACFYLGSAFKLKIFLSIVILFS